MRLRVRQLWRRPPPHVTYAIQADRSVPADRRSETNSTYANEADRNVSADRRSELVRSGV